MNLDFEAELRNMRIGDSNGCYTKVPGGWAFTVPGKYKTAVCFIPEPNAALEKRIIELEAKVDELKWTLAMSTPPTVEAGEVKQNLKKTAEPKKVSKPWFTCGPGIPY